MVLESEPCIYHSVLVGTSTLPYLYFPKNAQDLNRNIGEILVISTTSRASNVGDCETGDLSIPALQEPEACCGVWSFN